MARRRARDKSCLTRWFLEFQLKVEGDSDPVTSTTCATGGLEIAPRFADCPTAG